MLRFNFNGQNHSNKKRQFQYILCYGSTHWCYVIYIFYHTGKRLIQQVFIKIFPMTGIFFRKEQKIGFDICVSGLLFSCLYFIIGKYKMVFSFCVFAVINYPSSHF